MNTELTNEVANRINDLHQALLESVEQTKQSVNNAMMAAVEIGGHIEQLPRGTRMAWLRDHCPSLDQKQIAAYLAIAKTHKRRPDNSIDHRFFALLGMTDEKESYQHPTKGIAVNWLAWTGKLTGYFGELTKRQPVEQWDNDQRDAVAAQLKPIAELYQRITNGE